jgi:hypothetical protein
MDRDMMGMMGNTKLPQINAGTSMLDSVDVSDHHHTSRNGLFVFSSSSVYFRPRLQRPGSKF